MVKMVIFQPQNISNQRTKEAEARGEFRRRLGPWFNYLTPAWIAEAVNTLSWRGFKNKL